MEGRALGSRRLDCMVFVVTPPRVLTRSPRMVVDSHRMITEWCSIPQFDAVHGTLISGCLDNGNDRHPNFNVDQRLPSAAVDA